MQTSNYITNLAITTKDHCKFLQQMQLKLSIKNLAAGVHGVSLQDEIRYIVNDMLQDAAKDWSHLDALCEQAFTAGKAESSYTFNTDQDKMPGWAARTSYTDDFTKKSYIFNYLRGRSLTGPKVPAYTKRSNRTLFAKVIGVSGVVGTVLLFAVAGYVIFHFLFTGNPW